MAQVILQPAGNKGAREHYENTIANPVPLDRLRRFIDEELANDLARIHDSNEIPVWGVTPGKNNVNAKKWNKIKKGDVALFAANKKLWASSIATLKIRNRPLAVDLWGLKEDGETWEYIYFLRHIKKIDIPYILFNRAVGYADAANVQSFNVLDEVKSKAAIERFDFLSDISLIEVSDEDYAEIVKKDFDPKGPLDLAIKGTARREQSYLRKRLFGHNKIASCGICGKEYPVDFLIAAHIKKRASCTEEERMMFDHIVMPMCKFGCDDLYEKGYIGVSEGVIVQLKSRATVNIDQYIASILGRKCNYWNDDTAPFFRWHLDH